MLAGPQVPPRHAALKHRGRAYYEYARAGIEIDRPPREVDIAALELVGWSPPSAVLRVECGKGTYVRARGQGIPKTVVEAEHYLISPAASGEGIDRATLEWCIQLAQDNPPWRLSVQQHKLWRVR